MPKFTVYVERQVTHVFQATIVAPTLADVQQMVKPEGVQAPHPVDWQEVEKTENPLVSKVCIVPIRSLISDNAPVFAIWDKDKSWLRHD